MKLILFCLIFLVSSFASASTVDELKIETIMQIHYLTPSYKSPYDSVKITGREALVQVWRDLPPNPVQEELECLGYQWLLTGRGGKMGYGAAEVFKQIPELDSITLEIVEVEFEDKSVNGKGLLKREYKAKPYVRMRLPKKEISRFRIDNKKLKSQLRGNLETCLDIGRKINMQKEIKL